MRTDAVVAACLAAYFSLLPGEASAERRRRAIEDTAHSHSTPGPSSFDPAGSSSFDPILPASISAMAIGSGIGIIGAVEVRSSGLEANLPGILGGATTAVGGLTLLLVGITSPGDAGDPADPADPSAPARRASSGRARVAAGGMVLALGAGFAVAGASALALGSKDDDHPPLLVTGIATSALAAPFVIWGASTWNEDRGDRYASNGRFIAGSVLTGLGVVLTTGGVMMAALAVDTSGYWVIPAVPTLVLGTAGLGAGLPLMAAGGDVITENRLMPRLSVGPASVAATWQLQ